MNIHSRMNVVKHVPPDVVGVFIHSKSSPQSQHQSAQTAQSQSATPDTIDSPDFNRPALPQLQLLLASSRPEYLFC